MLSLFPFVLVVVVVMAVVGAVVDVVVRIFAYALLLCILRACMFHSDLNRESFNTAVVVSLTKF